jgi:hypothetical protein
MLQKDLRGLYKEACLKKSGKGNVFHYANRADREARRMRNRFKKEIYPYYCRHCNKYHLGKIRFTASSNGHWRFFFDPDEWQWKKGYVRIWLWKKDGDEFVFKLPLGFSKVEPYLYEYKGTKEKVAKLLTEYGFTEVVI